MSFKVIGIGEVLWDIMPSGRQLGGAPANFAYHARSLGADAFVVTRVGEDNLGREILQRFKAMEIADGVVQIDPDKPTGTAEVVLQEGLPQFTIGEEAAWDCLAATEAAQKAVKAADAVCFGSLGQRNPIARATIQQLMAAAPAEALRIFDINLRPPYYSRKIIEQSLRLANVLKLNDQELPVLAAMFDAGTGPQEQIQNLARRFDLRLVVLTRGPLSSFLYQDNHWSEHKSGPIEVVDTVGAGDAFTAALSMALLNRLDLQEVHVFAAQVARFVCPRSGATPVLPAQLRNKFAVRADRISYSASQAKT